MAVNTGGGAGVWYNIIRTLKSKKGRKNKTTMEKLTREQVKTKEDARQYAAQRLNEEIEILKKVKAEIEKGRDIEEMEEVRQPLAISASYLIEIELSWGGDADGFILYYDKDKELTGGVYYWADWGQYEEINLHDEEAELVELVYLGGDGAVFLP